MNQLPIKAAFLSLMLTLTLLVTACANTTSPTTEPAEMAMDMATTNEGDDTAMGSMDGMAMDEIPADLNTAAERLTDAGLFKASIVSNMIPVDINQMHSWVIHVETPNGEAVDDAEVTIDGGMPQHNHGFPTSPQVTDNLGDGDYLVEGVRFNMTGWWEMKFDISANGQSDTITFNVVVETGHSSESMDHSDHHSDHASHSEMGYEHDTVPNEGRAINIVMPAMGAEVEAGSMLMVKIATENFDIADQSNHWHLYLNDELHTMVEDGSTEVMLHDLAPGQYTIKTTLANDSHVEYEDGAMVTITVK